MSRTDLSRHAHQYYEDIKIRLAAQTRASIEQTVPYGPIKPERVMSNENFSHHVRLVDLDSVSCLFDKPHAGKTCILNYASYKNPGGFFLGGSPAQEEALCHESNLYPVLLAFDGTYYEWNKNHLNRALYLDRALYSPDVIFEHDGRTKSADVLTCAAPNYRTAHRFQKVTLEENNAIFKQRIHFMYSIAEKNGVDTLIAGAWGCGVFMQDAYTTCRLMIEALTEGNYKISNIYFAIPNANSSNFKGFKKYLDESKNFIPILFEKQDRYNNYFCPKSI